MAQDEQPDGPLYLVQPGDTLYSIAFRFGVTIEDLLRVNELTDANKLFVGDFLVIPGMEGVHGVLETRSVLFGENLRSLSRRYKIPIEQLSKLNRLVSPKELYVGSSLILPVVEEENAARNRTLVMGGQTFLEDAIIQGENPWSMIKLNLLKTPSTVIPQDVLFVSGETSGGPGGLPSPITDIQISDFTQGETGIIRVQIDDDLLLDGQLGDYELEFFEETKGSYVALQGIHALAETGLYPLTLHGELKAGGNFSFTQLTLINPGNYLFERIVVPPELIDPEVTQQEWELVRPLLTSLTRVRKWEGIFLSPSPFSDCINSSFGNRRSYNGSAFTYFHGGVDFCGGEGVEIKAPAEGMVVFASPLEVRGNFTLIDHGWGVYTAYLHQSEIFVQAGEDVAPGQLIGLVGNTGRSTGPHLHWEVWVNGIQVNPLDWLFNSYP